MRNKKIMSLTFISAVSGLLLSLTGCGNTVTYDIDNFLPNGTKENPYQIVKEPVTIKIFAPHSQGNPEYETLTMFKYLEEITNLRFEFTTCDTSAYSNRRSAIWSDPNYKPDLFLFNNPIAELVQFQENNFNAHVPFNDDNYTDSTGLVGNVIENYMPNYKALLENNFNINKEVESAVDAATESEYVKLEKSGTSYTISHNGKVIYVHSDYALVGVRGVVLFLRAGGKQEDEGCRKGIAGQVWEDCSHDW